MFREYYHICSVVPIISLFFSYVLHVFFFFLLCCQKGDFSGKINDKGCLPAGEKWLEQNLISIAGVAVGIAFLQVGPFHCSVLPTLFQFPFLLVKYNSTFHIFFQILGICFAQNLRADIFAQMAKWN